ncbi:hypothetical protein [Szabonella alba]|uniref:Uncharacterized protein n=1 Tax=Szabonella alba TaxID=2804194 RepID=A0A8K0VBD4_9RHOB|nr:hypothetical protein [Szabonella alba]MBL4918967.1 hypothetical protein [Szabonella alba]
MALTFPYPLSFLSRWLEPSQVTFALTRNDEMSGGGDGRYWAAQLASPIWRVNMVLRARYPEEGWAIDAKIDALNGSARAFLFSDPCYAPPVDPGGSVVVEAIGEDRTALAFAGLPAGFMLRVGMRLSIAWGADRQYLATISEEVTANSEGVTGLCSVMPYLPFGIGVGATVEMVEPVLKVIIPPGGHNPFTFYAGNYMAGGTLSLIQKV